MRLASWAQSLGRTPAPEEIAEMFPEASRATIYRMRDRLLQAWGIEPTGGYLRTQQAPEWR